MPKRTRFKANAARTKRGLAWGLTMTLLCPPCSGLLAAANAQAPVQRADNPTGNGPALPPPLPAVAPEYGAASILLFPFDNATNTPANDDVAGQVTDALKLRLDAVNAFTTTRYTKFLSPVQRALDDNILAQTDLVGPFDSQKADRIATQVETNYFITGEVESFSSDPSTRHVTIEVSADLRSTKTGNALRTLAFTGASGPYSYGDTVEAVQQRAIDSVASKLAAAINAGRPATPPIATASHSRGQAGQAFLLTVLAGALVYAVLHNSNSGNHNSSTTTSGTNSGTSTTTTAPGGPPAPP